MSINRQQLTYMINHIGKNNPELAICMTKWIPFLSNSINRISFITKRSDQDILQEILVGVSEINMIYNVPLYRYRGSLYEKVQENGSIVELITPRNNKSKKKRIWVQKDEVIQIKKGKLESTVYREIHQQFIDILSAHFTQKNGYKKNLKGEQFVVVRSDKDCLKLSKKSVHSIEKTTDTVELEEADKKIDNNLEDYIIFCNYVNYIKENVSETVGKVLDIMISDPGASINSIAEFLGISINKVTLAKCEIIRNIPFDFENSKQRENTNKKPIYLTVD